ncbi:MAG: hypothetical protein A2021_02700 [Elusimicrobia bacterium GWF2_52_66]|nr:MAG: hypothetical protein A2X33_04800 [Elusimicrobia bacterium GWA2_51_34]OGR85782.1 MAG: hypothetical protein A2021_02700 [Elusimicrobia bacterium GWF2_52_66]HAF96259.1 phosphatidate cytidylyltransferase [Elusimicrobiota bacterium]HCE97451.1 phosphatidate cytidylyltransferase [Elusimicrobiota bacterium]
MPLPRFLTAIAGIPLVIWFIHVGGLTYACFIFTVIMLSLYEYNSLLKLGRKPVQGATLFIMGMLLPVALFFDHNYAAQAGGDNFAGFFITLTVIFTMIYELFSTHKYLERIGLTLLGIFMVSWCLFHLIALRDLRPDGEWLTFMLIVTVWIMDTAAYVIGRRFGRRKLSTISPKKTWEGAAAGFIFAIGSVFVLRLAAKETVSPAFALAAGALIGVFGQVSDIAESMLKRAVGVKDSSNLLPGHGGVLDRFDSYIFLAPIIYYLAVFTR